MYVLSNGLQCRGKRLPHLWGDARYSKILSLHSSPKQTCDADAHHDLHILWHQVQRR